jgi:hypothetical protein
MNEKIPNRRDIMFRRYGMQTLTLRQVGALMSGLLPADLWSAEAVFMARTLPGYRVWELAEGGDGTSHKLDGHDLFLLGLEVLFY